MRAREDNRQLYDWLLQLLETDERHPSGGYPGWLMGNLEGLSRDFGVDPPFPLALFHSTPKSPNFLVVHSLDPVLDWMEQHGSFSEEEMGWIRAKITLTLAGG